MKPWITSIKCGMSDFYKRLSPGLKNERQFGQFCWAPAPCVSSGILALRLGFLKAGVDIKDSQLTLIKLGIGDFGALKEQDRANLKSKMPIPELGLALSEEITVTKCKWRPSVVIHHACANWRKEANFVAKLVGKKPEPNRHLFAPVYSLRKEDGSSDYPEAFIARLQDGDYPNILFLPAYASPIKNDSMLVLSDVFQAGLHSFETTDLCIDPETLAIKVSEWSDYLSVQATDLADKLSAEQEKLGGKG